MKFTEEMIAEDERKWHSRDVYTELGYCGKYMRDRRDMRNDDIRFYAYLMRQAHEMLKPVEPYLGTGKFKQLYRCGNCHTYLVFTKQDFCHGCGRKVKWDDL